MRRIFKKPVIAATVVIIILTVTLTLILIFNSPRIRVLSALYDAFDTGLIETCISVPMTADAGFVISTFDCSFLPDDSYFSGTGLKLSAMADTDNKAFDMKLTPVFLICCAPPLCIRQRNNVLGLSSPELYDKEFVFDAAKPFADYEGSALQEELGISLPDGFSDISCDLSGYLEDTKKNYSKNELKKKLLEADIRKTAGYAPLTVPQGYKYICESYGIKFTTGEYITVKIDKTGKLRCINYGSLSIYLCGDNKVTDEFNLEIERYTLSAESITPALFQYDSALSKQQTDLILKLTVHGTTENFNQHCYNTEKKLNITADDVKLTLFSEENEILCVNGNAYLALWPDAEPLCEDLPDEDPYNMKKNELQNAFSQIYQNLENNQLMKLIL